MIFADEAHALASRTNEEMTSQLKMVLKRISEKASNKQFAESFCYPLNENTICALEELGYRVKVYQSHNRGCQETNYDSHDTTCLMNGFSFFRLEKFRELSGTREEREEKIREMWSQEDQVSWYDKAEWEFDQTMSKEISCVCHIYNECDYNCSDNSCGTNNAENNWDCTCHQKSGGTNCGCKNMEKEYCTDVVW